MCWPSIHESNYNYYIYCVQCCYSPIVLHTQYAHTSVSIMNCCSRRSFLKCENRRPIFHYRLHRHPSIYFIAFHSVFPFPLLYDTQTRTHTFCQVQMSLHSVFALLIECVEMCWAQFSLYENNSFGRSTSIRRKRCGECRVERCT